jgi:hypothetical protein
MHPSRHPHDELGNDCPLILYVDDLFLTGDEKLIVGCKTELAPKFKMKDLGLMHYFLGLEVWQRSDETFLSQGKYIVEILQRFRMMDCKSMTTPVTINMKLLSDSSSDLVDPTMYRQLIGSLMYLVNTRSDICFAVNTLSQHMVEPRQVHWMAAKDMLECSGSKEYFRMLLQLGIGVISWLSREQTSVALNTVEAKYIAASIGSRESNFLQDFIRYMMQKEAVKLQYTSIDE